MHRAPARAAFSESAPTMDARSWAREATRRDCGRLEWSVLDWNEPSIEFYKSLGANLLNEWIVNRITGENLVKLAEMR